MANQFADPVVVLTVVGGLCYATHHYASIAFFDRLLQRLGIGAGVRVSAAVYAQRGYGIVAMGIVPAVVVFGVYGIPAEELGLQLTSLPLSIVCGLLGFVPVVGALWLRFVPAMLERYPEIRIPVWTWGLIVRNSISWVFYVAAYEFLFRGVWLLPAAREVGLWPAVAVTAVFYSLAHLPKHPLEGFLTLPAGIVLGWAAVTTGSLLGPFIFHFLLAAGAEVMAVRANPQFRFMLFARPGHG